MCGVTYVHMVVEFGTGYPTIQIIAVLSGYTIAASALFVYIQKNIQSMVYLGLSCVFLATTFLLPLLPNHWINPSTTLSINFVLLFGCYALIGYSIILSYKNLPNNN